MAKFLARHGVRVHSNLCTPTSQVPQHGTDNQNFLDRTDDLDFLDRTDDLDFLDRTDDLDFVNRLMT